jgi:hypothetical protein
MAILACRGDKMTGAVVPGNVPVAQLDTTLLALMVQLFPYCSCFILHIMFHFSRDCA